jgi:hypothetical protein
MMRLIPPTVVVVALAVGLCACGASGSSSPRTTSKTTTSNLGRSKSYRERVADCVGGLGFETRNAGNALRVESPGGRLIANIQTFPSAAEAREFNKQVAVAHGYGGRGVAVWLRDAGADDRATVADCLTP